MRFRLSLIILVWLGVLHGFAQEVINVEGRILNAQTNESVPFASVGIVGSSLGTSSNADGYFSLKVPPAASNDLSIRITCVGFESQNIKVTGTELEVRLNESRTILKEVYVFGRTLSPHAIVRKAFKNIKRNYNTKPFISENFYRHYCKDDTVYGRLIEGAVEIYKRKGYKVQQPHAGWKEEVRFNQLRRSFDNSQIGAGHAAISLYHIMSTDIASYQAQSQGKMDLLYMGHDVSRLKRNMKNYRLELDGITEYDGEKVYKISYAPADTARKMLFSLYHRSGTLYISTTSYAIVRSERTFTSPYFNTKESVSYRKFNGKYYPYHSLKEGTTFVKSRNFTHFYHVELITTNIISNGLTPFEGKEPGREALLKIDYDSTFWNSYNVLKATPLEESIVADLQKSQSLEGQYNEFVRVQRERYFGGIEDEENFNKLLASNRNLRPVYIDFWASWCAPCIQQMANSKALMEKFKGRVAFVFLSLDDDVDAWRSALARHNLQSPFAYHFRVGTRADAVKLFTVNEIPRYVLVDKQGNFVDLNARGPADPTLISLIESLLMQKIEP